MNSLIDALTVRQTAERLGVTQRYIMMLIAEGKLEGSFKLGMQRFVPRSAVERWEQQRRQEDRNDQ